MVNSARNRGFTLVEMLIVISIISILAAIAYPSYRSQVLKTQRTEAKTALADTAQRLERCYTQFNVYNDTDDCTIASTLSPAGTGSFDTEEGHYTITATALGASSFTLRAARKDGDDSRCGNFVLNHLGQRGSLGTIGSDANDCW
ncbi:type IV pilin protein [Algiphilus aromaticivorans]|uniref:type IV pilin protein n=1 Tax=Algiphilus aromaticivorans TaxID=382454 RepID=UPI00069399DB|nr:type IV pilin protein [Algiphilus aromaticivorans]